MPSPALAVPLRSRAQAAADYRDQARALRLQAEEAAGRLGSTTDPLEQEALARYVQDTIADAELLDDKAAELEGIKR